MAPFRVIAALIKAPFKVLKGVLTLPFRILRAILPSRDKGGDGSGYGLLRISENPQRETAVEIALLSGLPTRPIEEPVLPGVEK